MKINPEITSLISNFFKDKPVKKAYIFGSFARNEQRANSDIDILLELDYSQSIGWDFYGWNEELSEILNLKVDLASEEN